MHFFVVFVFFLVSLFFILIPHLPLMRMDLVDWLSNHYEQSTQVGLGCLLATFLCFLGFYSLEKGRYLVIRMGVDQISIDLKVLKKAIEACFVKEFDQKISLQEVGLDPKSHLELMVHLAPLSREEQEKLFPEVNRHLSLLLKERFGYVHPFYFTAAKMRP